ncbi:MAG: MFS transporter [Verrucomicrobia bacterium]|nr:MFS transporter [Verrucomicrobiota bacterium]
MVLHMSLPIAMPVAPLSNSEAAPVLFKRCEPKSATVSDSLPSPKCQSANKWIALAVILVGPFLGVIDFFIANIGVPSIRLSLGASFSEMELVIAGYGLTYAVCLITGGRLGDIYGRKMTFILGMIGFTLTSAFCGLAPTPSWLIFWRLVQGCTAAAMFPQALSFIQVNFTGSAKRIAFSLYGAMIGFGSIVGQLLGGFLIHANLFQLGWRPIFLINLPIGIATIISASFLLKESRAKAAPKLDLGGVGILTIGLALFSYPFMEGPERGWAPWAWVCLLASFPVLWAFWLFERRQSAKNQFPLIEPMLFRDRGFVVGLIVTCIYFAGHSSMILVLSLYLQFSLGLNPMYAGFALVPFSFAFLLGSTVSGKINGYLGRRSLHLGVAVLMIGILALAFLAAPAPEHLTAGFVLACFIYGIGRGLVTSPLYNTVLSGIPHKDAGAASGVTSTMPQLANSIGIALIGAVVFSTIPKNGATSGDYAHGFVVSSSINLVMLGAAAGLIFLIPKSRGRDLPVGEHAVVES